MTGRKDGAGGEAGRTETSVPPLEVAEGSGVFRILVVGGFIASPELAPRSAPPREPVAITPATFDDVMTQLDPSLVVELPDPSSPHGKPVRVPLSFRRLRSFRPDVLVQEVEAFRAFRGSDTPPPVAEPPPGATAPVGRSVLDDILAGMAGSPPAAGSASRGNDAPKAALLRSILGHPEVRRLEQAWRGLKLLVDRAGQAHAPGVVTIEIVSAAIDEVDGALARVSGPVDLLVVDYELGAEARDLQRAERWASRAQAIPAPLLTNASPEVLGFDDLGQLARTSRRIQGLENPRAVAFQSLTERESTRWLLFAMNGVLLREAHTAETARVKDVSFAESAPLVGRAAWVVAAAAARAFTGCGWGCALTEPEYRTISNLTVHLVDDRGSPMSLAVESLVTSEVAREAAAAGVAVITGVRDRDVAVLPFAPMVYRGPTGPQGVRPAASLTLADQLFVARLVPLITELGAAIPPDVDRVAACETAKIALLSIFGTDPAYGPIVDATLAGRPPVLEITLRPRGFRGVQIPEITLSAPLG